MALVAQGKPAFISSNALSIFTGAKIRKKHEKRTKKSNNVQKSTFMFIFANRK